MSFFEFSQAKNKLGRPYNPGRPLAMEERQKILQLYEKGHRISHIARIIGVTHSCVSKIMTRFGIYTFKMWSIEEKKNFKVQLTSPPF